ncbi:MAG TPA: hypothetical protein VHL54_13510 [Actinomycetota bacterium]|nr:hypothetical protein [Actinomycetota bacterium]
MTESILVALLALTAAAWIARPLLGRRQPVAEPADLHTADLMEAKQGVYRSIIDLEIDHQLGKIDNSDYLELKRQSKAEALGILRELEGESSEEAGEQTLEDEIEAARARLRRQ